MRCGHRSAATPPPRTRSSPGRIARCFLFERLSGLPAATAPGALDDSAFRTKTADFPATSPRSRPRTPGPRRGFLAERGIKGEPATWQPTSRFLEELKLPGPDPAAVAMPELHRLIGMNNLKLGAAAARLNTTLDTLRHLLGSHPAPRPDPEPGTPLPTPCNRAYVKAKAALSANASLNSTNATASRCTTSPRSSGSADRRSPAWPATTACRSATPAADHAPPSTATGFTTSTSTTAGPADIAAEAAMSTTTLANWARFHAIPLRARGGASHSATLAAEHAAAAAPALIRPALRGIGGGNASKDSRRQPISRTCRSRPPNSGSTRARCSPR